MPTDVAGLVASVTADVRGHCVTAMTAVGKELAADLKDIVKVPVGRSNGRVTVRSKPGEPPRKETGKLQGSVSTETSVAGPKVVTAVGTGVVYSRYLEDGTSRMKARPHVEVIYRRADANAASRVAALLPPNL